MATRAEFINEARKLIGNRFSHQGRSKIAGYDCGGLVLCAGRNAQLTDLEFLGYANFPTEGKFEELLRENAVETDSVFTFPHTFTSIELDPGDLLSFDYGNGDGVRHIAIVTKFDGRRFWLIDAQPPHGVTEHPLAYPFVQPKTIVRRYLVKGLSD